MIPQSISVNIILTNPVYAEYDRQMEVPQDYLQRWARLLTVLNLRFAVQIS